MAGGGHGDGGLEKLLPSSKIYRWTSPLRRFLAIEASSGILLLFCTFIALGLANSPIADKYDKFWHMPCQIGIGDYVLEEDLLHVVNDGLMAIFFFVIGLEIKREIVAGELREIRKALLPIIAALGGMVAPALVFISLKDVLQVDPAAAKGWAIPMATDIAFVVGILALFGNRVPLSLRVLLLTLAIVDDLGAVLIIAFVFTETILWSYLGITFGALVVTWIMNRIGVRNIGMYTLVGLVAWVCVLKAGVHPTVAGVILGLMTPSKPWIGVQTLSQVLSQLQHWLDKAKSNDELPARLITRARFAVNESASPLDRLEYQLHPWMAFAIMPIFALANAGVPIRVEAISEPVSLAIAAGLAIGKPVGILGFCFVAVMLGIARLPEGVNWSLLAGGASLAGIGFTMSLFLAGLALPPEMLSAGKIGTLLGSLVSTILGAGILYSCTSKPEPEPEPVGLPVPAAG